VRAFAHPDRIEKAGVGGLRAALAETLPDVVADLDGYDC